MPTHANIGYTARLKIAINSALIGYVAIIIIIPIFSVYGLRTTFNGSLVVLLGIIFLSIPYALIMIFVVCLLGKYLNSVLLSATLSELFFIIMLEGSLYIISYDKYDLYGFISAPITILFQLYGLVGSLPAMTAYFFLERKKSIKQLNQ